MAQHPNQSRLLLSPGLGLRVIAAIHFVEAIALAVAIVGLWNPEDPLGSLVEAVFWVLLTILLLAIAWGLWSSRAWARVLALVVHWPTFLGAVVLLLLSLYVHVLVPAGGGIEVAHGLAVLGLVVFPPAVLISAWTLWYLHRRTQCVSPTA